MPGFPILHHLPEFAQTCVLPSLSSDSCLSFKVWLHLQPEALQEAFLDVVILKHDLKFFDTSLL